MIASFFSILRKQLDHLEDDTDHNKLRLWSETNLSGLCGAFSQPSIIISLPPSRLYRSVNTQKRWGMRQLYSPWTTLKIFLYLECVNIGHGYRCCLFTIDGCDGYFEFSKSGVQITVASTVWCSSVWCNMTVYATYIPLTVYNKFIIS